MDSSAIHLMGTFKESSRTNTSKVVPPFPQTNFTSLDSHVCVGLALLSTKCSRTERVDINTLVCVPHKGVVNESQYVVRPCGVDSTIEFNHAAVLISS